MPLPVCFGLLTLGVILLWFTRRQRAGKIFVTIGTLVLILLSYSFVADTILRPLEYKYPALLLNTDSYVINRSLASAKWVVVLGGGVYSDPKLPITTQLSSGSVVRLVEAIRIHKILPQTKLLIAGGSVFDETADSEAMAELALNLGVDKKDIVLVTDARDTVTQARRVKLIIGSDFHILVTSASHMVRSVALFRKLGMNPIPAPTNYISKRKEKLRPGIFFPGVKGLYKAQRAIYEYLGLIWAKLINTK